MFVVFDIESTGLDRYHDDVIQFAYACFDNNKVCYRAESLYFYYPGMSWGEEAYKVHGIPLEFLQTQADKFEENLVKMAAILNHANVCGHNSDAFDCPFVHLWLQRMGISRFGFNVTRDTMVAFRPVTHTARVSLVNLTAKMGITEQTVTNCAKLWFKETHERAHDAAYDVTATALLALQALAKGYMSFEEHTYAQVQMSADEIMSEMSTTAKSLDPKGFAFKCDGDWVYVNHNRALFPDLSLDGPAIQGLRNAGMLVEKPFVFVEPTSYVCESPNVVMVVESNKLGDIVSFKVGDNTVSEDNVDLKTMINMFNKMR